MIVFHAPQASQRPDHLAEAAPQFWHTKEEEGFAIARADQRFVFSPLGFSAFTFSAFAFSCFGFSALAG
jgi:hypothetical protein